jgi:hypothetical protein
MDRTVRRIESTPSKAQHEELRPISAYDAAENIVLLGDPGAGKTHTFRECAARSGGRYVTARAFLVTPAAKFDGTLFIDGLDEKRAGRSDRDTVDALIEKLFEVGPGKVRISCRAADWLGDSDLAALRPYFELSGDPIVLQLGRLSGDEQRVVLQAEGLSAGDAAAFLQEATDRALGDFLENPQNLIMLLRAVQTGKWPATRKELFEFSTQLMLKEFDNDRARAGAGIYSVDELRPVAGAACAARLISDIEAVSLTDNETSKAIPSYRGLSMLPPEKVIAALGRRVFVAGPVPESVDYAHRTTAEYLGAVWLGPDGKAAAQVAYQTLGTDVDALRLRAEMLHRMYGNPFGLAAITTLLKDIAASASAETVTGILYTLSEDMPLADIPAVLDGLQPAQQASRATRRNEWEVARFIDRTLLRAWSEIDVIEPARALRWLKLRNSYSNGNGRGLSDALRRAIRERHDRLSAITDHFFATLIPDKDQWLRLGRYREITLLVETPAELLDHMLAHMARPPPRTFWFITCNCSFNPPAD